MILSVRYGGDVRNPSAEELSRAVSEVYHEDIPGMTEDDYAEHPSAGLRCGFDDGPMYVLDIYEMGTQTLRKDPERRMVLMGHQKMPG